MVFGGEDGRMEFSAGGGERLGEWVEERGGWAGWGDVVEGGWWSW